MNLVKINAEYLKTANYALFHNRIPVCQAVEITNVSERPVEGVKVVCSGEFISPYENIITGRINPGETIRISPFSISPASSKLAAITERVVTDFKLSVTSEEETIGEKICEIELMPYDHWTGTTILPQTLASFITPNHPSINGIVVKSAEILKKLTGSSSFNAYQSGDSNVVRQQVAAVFAAIHSLGIVYRGTPASYEAVGQRITMPDQVITSKTANCIELTLLMASVLEAIGINTTIIIQSGHAYLGVWLVDDCYPCSVCDDPAFIEKKCSHGIDEMLVLECTQMTQENTSFENAIRVAEVNLADHSVFEMFIDVKRSRLERILPLPARTEVNGEWTFETTGVDHDSCVLEVKEHDRYDLTHIANSGKELTKFDIWERKLLDFSLRNSLLNLSLRRRAIQFISFAVNRVEDHLQDGKEYCILPKPNIEFSVDKYGSLIRSKMYDQLHDLILNDTEHNLLHTFLPESETKTILKNISRVARNAIEETGANSLFLAIGTLRWFETEHSTTPRYAPLLLLPVEMVYKKTGYHIRTRDEEITLNITLLEFLRQNYNITIKGLDPLPLDESGVDVPLIFALIRDALKEQKRWDVEEECILGIFSFSKFLMWNDIHTHRDELLRNDIICSLLANRLTWTPDLEEDSPKETDKSLSPADIALPVSVDSSQLSAVIAGGKGKSFIIYGPPGTGKSQTITNLIANALYQGKRVLFVAEKMAALSVVQSRLEKIGLDPFCLELHSNKSTKRHVLQQLEKALKVKHIIPPSQFATQASRLLTQRKQLLEYINALHEPDPADGLSLYDCIIKAESISEPPLADFKFDKRIDSLLAAEGIKGVEEMLGKQFETVIRLVGQPSLHPLRGLHLTLSMIMDRDKVIQQMDADIAIISEILKDPDSIGGTEELRKKLLRDNTAAIFDEDPYNLRRQWRAAKAKWLIPRFFAKRKFMERIRLYNPFITEGEVDPLLDTLNDYRQRKEKGESLNRVIREYFNKDQRPEEIPSPSLLEQAVESLSRWASHPSEMRDWLHWSEYSEQLRGNGLGSVVDSLESEERSASSARDAFLKSLFRHKAEDKIFHSELLVTFEGMLFDEKTAAYRKMTEQFQLLTRKELYARLASKVPRMTDSPSSGSEIGLLNRNISNGGRGLSLRDLFDQLPTLLPRLCPCMLMSPMSVARYLDIMAEKFDLVIFDEASQMPTSEAVGAIARGKALIVVGDPKQMPPTSFFSTSNVDVEEASIDDMESILEDCRTLDMPALQLSWHYRSRHESLIAFSNNEYYDGSLITFPSVDDRKTKVHYIPISGYYDKGGSRSNQAEAEAIVDEIERRLKSETLRSLSIGVIAFSIMQQGLIEDILQERLEKDRDLQEAATNMYEPIFVKNLENVQGDERDVILFSIGYGPDKNGKVSMNFGPLNNNGGERRLNVAVSRARHEMYIFSTLKSSDIDLRRSKALGVEGLKHFLQYAETQSLPSNARREVTHSHSEIADQIAEELRKRGYVVATDVGRSKFRVDVAVENKKNPGAFALGILLDGENYRDTMTTRDREVVQPSMLQSLGWKVMRVWSVDWHNNRQRVIDRIIERLYTDSKEDKPDPQPIFDITKEKIDKKETIARKYVQHHTPLYKAVSLPLFDLIRNILYTEQPMTFPLLCRRVNALQDGNRLTSSFKNMLKTEVDQFYQDDSGAIWLSKEDSLNYPYYRTDSGRDISDIPDIEIINAVIESVEEQVAIDEEDLSLIVARKLGFTRRGSIVDAAIKKALESLVVKGKLETIGKNLRIKNDSPI